MKFRFSSKGNFTVVLRSAYREDIKNDTGAVLYTKNHRHIEAVFENGFFETDDIDIMKAIVEGGCSGAWGKTVYWHPSMEVGKIMKDPRNKISEDAKKEYAFSKQLADKFEKDKIERAKLRQKQIKAAAEGSIPRE